MTGCEGHLGFGFFSGSCCEEDYKTKSFDGCESIPRDIQKTKKECCGGCKDTDRYGEVQFNYSKNKRNIYVIEEKDEEKGVRKTLIDKITGKIISEELRK